MGEIINKLYSKIIIYMCDYYYCKSCDESRPYYDVLSCSNKTCERYISCDQCIKDDNIFGEEDTLYLCDKCLINDIESISISSELLDENDISLNELKAVLYKHKEGNILSKISKYEDLIKTYKQLIINLKNQLKKK